ncbi:MAG: hypothetical protein AB7I33_07060, partial [Gemmatimonadales bacterium]
FHGGPRLVADEAAIQVPRLFPVDCMQYAFSIRLIGMRPLPVSAGNTGPRPLHWKYEIPRAAHRRDVRCHR